ncbi:MAG: hypothetical protein ACOCXP_03845 [Candidatus Dojkabacteria bacterium]
MISEENSDNYFLKGAGRVFSFVNLFGGSLRGSAETRVQRYRDDYQAIKKDWQMVGSDIATAIYKYEQKQK